MSGLSTHERKQMKLKLAKYVMNVLSEDDEAQRQVKKDFEQRSNSHDSGIMGNNENCEVDVV